MHLSDPKIRGKLNLFGIASVEGEKGGFREQLQIDTVNHGSDFLNTILPPDHADGKQWVIIIDEFDQLKNTETIDFFTALSKQMSVDKVKVKFAFCGVASNLNDLIGSHESVERYIRAVDLRPLRSGDIMDIVDKISYEFVIKLSKGQQTRIAQISCGYPHFAHLIMSEMIKQCFDFKYRKEEITADIYKASIQRAAKGAATRLQTAYETATRRGTDRYIEVLWAAADGSY